MKLKDYIKRLNEVARENPEALNATVFTAKDDEGNGFDAVHFSPQAITLSEKLENNTMGLELFRGTKEGDTIVILN